MYRTSVERYEGVIRSNETATSGCLTAKAEPYVSAISQLVICRVDVKKTTTAVHVFS